MLLFLREGVGGAEGLREVIGFGLGFRVGAHEHFGKFREWIYRIGAQGATTGF